MKIMKRRQNRFQMNLRIKNLTTCLSLLALIACLTFGCLVANSDTNTPVLSSRAAFLRAQRASRQSQSQQQSSTTNQTLATSSTASTVAASSTTTTTTTTTSTPSSSTARTLVQTTSTSIKPKLASSLVGGKPRDEQPVVRVASVGQHANRTTRTADIFQNGDGYNIFVTNTCEREQMQVKITMSKEFNGVIHTRNQRQKSVCTIDGNGGTEYNLVISHVLNPQDPNYCGVIKARRESPDDKDLLSVVIAVRFHRNIELSDDKFFLLNCTNRCRKPDCTVPTSNKLLLAESPNRGGANGRVVAEETPESGERETVTSRPGDQAADRKQADDECTIWKFPWLITLLWCMGILLLAMTISHCIMCSSLVCRCVKTEVEEREPSVYEDDLTDDEDKLYNRKNHPMRIDYDNRDIYKTSNNYEPYCLDEAQTAAEQRRQKKSRVTQRN